ncbi:MAG: hypothetical protein HDT28_00775 [Clostridiales bacterium]|nr:hypothetical protein [Clostridiales bacterium]
MKNVLKKGILPFIIGALGLVIISLVIWFTPSSVARADEYKSQVGSFTPELVINKYEDGEAELLSDNLIEVKCNSFGKNITFDCGSWYKNEKSGQVFMDTRLSDDISFAYLNAQNSKLSVSYYDEYNEYNVLTVNADAELAEHINSASVTDTYTANNIVSEDRLLFAGLTNTRTNTFYSDGSRTTSDEKSDDGWTNLSEDDIIRLKNLTSDKKKKEELLDIGRKEKDITNIVDYIPEKYFAIETNTMFIGQEYGFVILSTLYERTYTFYGRDACTYFNSVIVFSIDRESNVLSREYPVTLNIAFTASGACYYYPNGWGDGDDKATKDISLSQYYDGYEGIFIADPAFSSRINNLYDINAFNEDYDLYKDTDTSLSQVRMNYNGYAGKKVRKKNVSMESISSMILTIASSAASTAMKFITKGKCNPFIALIGTGITTISEICKFANEEKVFNGIYYNNEKNIFTFDAPSQKPNKSVIACIGVDTQSDNIDYKPGSKASAIFGKNGHYAQSIFVLNEVNKPTAFTSYVNFALGFQSANKDDSQTYRYPVPDRFNYSGLTVKLWDNGNTEKVTVNNDTEIYAYANNRISLNCAVEEDGYYNLKLKNFERIISSYDEKKLPIEKAQTLNDITEDRNSIFNGMVSDISGDVISIRLYLNKGSNKVSLELADVKNIPCLGASFVASIEKCINEISVGSTKVVKLKPNESGIYKFDAPKTGIYRIDNTTATIDVLNENNIVVIANRKDGEVLLTEGKSCFIKVKNTSSVALTTELCATFKPETTELNYSGTLDAHKSIWYPIRINNSGTYVFDADGDIRIAFKDSKPRDVFCGSNKVVFPSGTYFLYVENLNDTKTDYSVSISFEPGIMKANHPHNVYLDTSYKFIPPITGKYRLTVDNEDYILTIDGKPYTGEDLTKGKQYIITAKIKRNIDIGAKIQIDFVPKQEGVFHFNDKVNLISSSAAFSTEIDGEFQIDSNYVTVYSQDLTVISKVNNTYLLSANEIYYIVNEGQTGCEVVFYAKQIPVNTQFNVLPNSTLYYRICPDVDGLYSVEASGQSTVAVFEYGNLSKEESLTKESGSYRLSKGSIYYVVVKTNANPDVITIHNNEWDGLFEITEGLMFENVLSANNYFTTNTFIPEFSGLYKFVFYRDRNVDFKISLESNGQAVKEAEFVPMNFVLIFECELRANTKYNLNYELQSNIPGNTYLAFGIFKTISPSNFVVYADGKLQDNSGDANIVALGKTGEGFTTKQIAVSKQFGDVTYKVLNAPIIDNSPAVTISGNGLLRINNKLPQWTSFAVEINVGKCEYGDIVLDEGISKIINFVIYNKVENIEIIDEDNAFVTIVDVAPNSSINLYAKIYPLFAAQADTLSFSVKEDDKKYISLNSSGNKATIFGVVTTPNNTYARVYAFCGNEFTVVVMVRVHAEEITATSALDTSQFNGSTAYEIIVETGNIGTLNLSNKTNINYLKIRGGSVKEINDFNLQIGSRSFVLVLEDIIIHGTNDSVIYSTSSDLSVYFSDNVELYGKDGDLDIQNGAPAIKVKCMTVYQIGTQEIVIQGGNGYSYKTSQNNVGGDGGIAILSDTLGGKVELKSIHDFVIKGGNGGNGAKGIDGSHATENGKKGSDGGNGSRGGNGGIAIFCVGTLKISGNKINILGGNGGNGGNGGTGGNGGNGAKGDSVDASPGQRGGDGGNGGDGALGGEGAVAIYNDTNISWQTNWSHVDGEDGVYGNGGNGGNGGRGGDGADDDSTDNDSSPGGDGGNGGNGGEGNKNGRMGNGGDGGNGGNPGANGDGEHGGNGGYGYNGGNGGNGGSTEMWLQSGGNGGNGGDAYGGTVGQGGNGGYSGVWGSDGSSGSSGTQRGEKHKPDA